MGTLAIQGAAGVEQKVSGASAHNHLLLLPLLLEYTL